MTAKYLIDGPIGYWYGFSELYSFFEENKEAESYHIIINSPGGLVDEGTKMYDLIKSQKKPVTTEIYAAHSIASIVALAGNTRLIRPSGEMLIHLPWVDPGPVNENDLEEVQKAFSRAKSQILNIYERETGQKRKDLEGLMSEERTLNAEEAVLYGFATGYAEGEVMEVEAKFDKPIFALSKKGLTRGTDMKKLDEILNGVKEILTKTEEVQALSVALDNGQTLELRTNDTKPKEGDVALIEGKTPEDGAYKAAENGFLYNIVGGKVTSIDQPELIEAKQVGDLILNSVKAVKDSFSNEVKALNGKLGEVTGLLNQITEQLKDSQGEVKALQEELTAVKAGTTSTYTPPKANAEEGDETDSPEGLNFYSGFRKKKADLRKKRTKATK